MQCIAEVIGELGRLVDCEPRTDEEAAVMELGDLTAGTVVHITACDLTTSSTAPARRNGKGTVVNVPAMGRVLKLPAHTEPRR